MQSRNVSTSTKAFRGFCVVCLMIALLVFGGIYDDYHELETIDLIQVISIDHQEDMVTITALGSQMSNEKPAIYKGSGEAMNKAIANMQTEAGTAYLHFGHVKYIVLSDTAASSKISDVLDYCIRMPDIGLNAAIYYVDGSAGKTMQDVEEGKNLSEILDSMAAKGLETSVMYRYTLIDVISSLLRNGFAMTSEFAVEEGKVVPKGLAVLPEKGDPIHLNKDEMRLLALLEGRLKNFSEVITGDDDKGVGVDISETNVEYSILWQDDKWMLNIEISMQCGLDELHKDQEMLDREGLKQIEEAIHRRIYNSVNDLIQKSYNLGLDICGLGQRAYLLTGKKETMDYNNISYQLIVNATLNRTYAIGEGAEQ